MASRWVTLIQGSIPEVITLQSSCEASGIPTFVPDMSLMEWDPTIRGGDIFALQLQVPADRLEDARTLLVPSTPVANTLAHLGNRVRWCIAFSLTAPVGIWLGLRYLYAARGLEEKPFDHRWTVASFWLCVLLTLAFAVTLRGMFA
jgi:hypothetical protein